MSIPEGAQHEDELGLYYKIGRFDRLLVWRLTDWYKADNARIKDLCKVAHE
jgi:hypothetical protein